MNSFPIHLLQALNTRHYGFHTHCQQSTLHITLHPFDLQKKSVETHIRLDGIALDLSQLHAHEHRHYHFPINPEEGYIDGSVYLQNQHVPVDVTDLIFGTFTSQGLPVQIKGILTFSAISIKTWSDTAIALSCILELPPTKEQIHAAITTAIIETNANSMHDVGKLMGWLTRAYPNWEDRRALHDAVCHQLKMHIQ